MTTEPVTRETWDLTAETAKLGISLRHLSALVKQHAPPILRAGRRVLFDEVAHRALMEALRCPIVQAGCKTGIP